jgi:hypothetical protein
VALSDPPLEELRIAAIRDAGRSVLVADDDPAHVQLIAICCSLGFDLSTATDGPPQLKLPSGCGPI